MPDLRVGSRRGWDTEAEAEGSVWRRFSVVTTTRARRMGDAQFIAEMLMLTIDRKIVGSRGNREDSRLKRRETGEINEKFRGFSFRASM